MEPTLQETLDLCRKAHYGKKDKIGVDYFHHPISVSDLLPSWAPKFEFQAALLHDVVADTKYTLKDLEDLGYVKETLDIVDLLTDTNINANYYSYIDDIVKSNNINALRVKIADNIHNSHPDRVSQLPSISRATTSRYAAVRRTMLIKLEELCDVDFYYFDSLCKDLGISSVSIP